MVTQLTLRRKLQKKKKRSPYGRCPECGCRTDRRVFWDEKLESYVLEDACHRGRRDYCRVKPAHCGWSKRIPWSGGGIGRHIRQPPQG